MAAAGRRRAGRHLGRAPGSSGDRVDRHRVRRSPGRPGPGPGRGQAGAVRGVAAGAGAGGCHPEPRPGPVRPFTCTPAASAAASRSASPRPSSTARRTAGDRLRRPGCRAVPVPCRPAGKADGCGAPGVPGRGPYLRPARPGIRRAAVRGARLRTACPHQEPVLEPPPALARRRQAGPGRVHGVHQPGLGRAPAAAGLQGSRLQLLPSRMRPVPAAPSAMGKGRPARHQRLAAGPGLRAALAAARCLRGPRL